MHVRAVHIVALLVPVALVAVGCSQGDRVEVQKSVPGSGPTTTVTLAGSVPPCDGDPGLGGEVPSGAAPGDLVASVELAELESATDPDSTNAQSAGFPENASVWRILYVSTGFDEHDLQLVCGLAALPDKALSENSATGNATMVAWSHGTVGTQQVCQPSSTPETMFWGPMGAGIGSIAWGSGLGAKKGRAADGALQTMLDRGWVVSATDYLPNDTYLVGRVAAANVIDAARATTQLVERESGDDKSPRGFDTLLWGHSQGGHAALWAGQLFDTYLAAAPNADATPLALSSVAVEAPASNLLAQPDAQPGVSFGDGLADWEMHKSIEIFGLPIAALEMQIGPALFSYIFGSWAEFSARGTPEESAATPAFPTGAGDLDLSAVATPQGTETIAAVSALCLGGDDAGEVKKLTDPYRNAAKAKMLTESFWNLPGDYSDGEFFHGGVDRTCARTSDGGTRSWCDWIRWNVPGPLGDNPYPKAPTRDGSTVPMLIAQGGADQVIHCIPTGEDTDGDRVASPKDCMSVALYESLRDSQYCPPGANPGSRLQLSVFRPDGSGSPGTHLSIPGQIASEPGQTDNLSFAGSPLDEFMTASLDRSLDPGCTAEVLNAP